MLTPKVTEITRAGGGWQHLAPPAAGVVLAPAAGPRRVRRTA
jgi:hypothetical protein